MSNLGTNEWWRRPLQKPRQLTRGDRVAVVTPCWGGPATFPARYEAGKRFLADRFGLEVVETAHALAEPDWIDANPAARADDLMQAFHDPAIKGIIASIGGDDAVRLIPCIDLAVIRDNPKLFVGYSDLTVIHFGCLKAGLGTLHGPTVMSGFAENAGMSPLSTASFYRAAFETQPIGELPDNTEGWTVEHLPWKDPANQDTPRRRMPSDGIKKLRGVGRARGHLIGGCAEVLEMLKATPWWPPLPYWDNAILFYETSEEAPPDGSVLRWLRNFAAQGILSRLAGIVLARPGGQMDEARRASQKRTVLHALDEAGLQNLPVLADLDFGHTDPIATLPYGVTAEIDCDAASFRILEAAVRK
jgi:muramoyltetrapeptide carboxypeptidase LdcA involved in peptidoglycan recycling